MAHRDGCDNYSILERNTLDGLGDGAGHLYLKLRAKYQGDDRRAFLEASRYDEEFGRILGLLFAKTAEIRTSQGIIECANPVVEQDLEKFAADRWFHNFREKVAPLGVDVPDVLLSEGS